MILARLRANWRMPVPERCITVASLALALTAVLLATSGCAGPSIHVDAPPPIPAIVQTDHEVSVPCVRPGDIPPAPDRTGPLLTGNAVHDADILAAKDALDIVWQNQVQAILGGCTITDSARKEPAK